MGVILYSINNQSLTLSSNELKSFPPQPRTGTTNWSMWNEFSCWMVTRNGWLRTKRRNNLTERLSLDLKSFYLTQQTWERLWNGFWRNVIYEPFSNLKLSTILASGKDAVPASKGRGVVYEIPCGNCEDSYIGETKRSLSTRLKEHHRHTLPRNILKRTEENSVNRTCSPTWPCFQLGLRPCSTSRK